MSIGRTILWAYASLLLLGIIAIHAQQPKAVCAQEPKAAEHKTSEKQKLPNRTDPGNSLLEWQSALVIKLKGSREQPTAGSDFGISADIENISDHFVYLSPRGLTMTAPPEVDAKAPEDWPAFLPGPWVVGPSSTEHQSDKAENQSGKAENQLDKPENKLDTVVALAPHSRITAFWSGNLHKLQRMASQRPTKWYERVCQTTFGEDCDTLANNIYFPPGKYTITVVGSYWDTADGALKKVTQHRTETASTDLDIVAAQTTVLFGAAIGGLVAFLLIPTLRPTSTSSNRLIRIGKFGAGLVTAMLLSMVVTILLARLSESQFLIKVSVNDFWGALTVGFIITASGTTILRQFTVLGKGSTGVAQNGDSGSKVANSQSAPHNANSGEKGRA